VKTRLGQIAPTGLFVTVMICLVAFAPIRSFAAPYAAMVIDARTGEVLHSRNADTRLHPASLTKMMTLYITFEAIRNGEISLDTQVRISRNAASEPPSKLGLQSGQRIRLRYLIRAAAVKSANDAATALGEAIEGSEAAFARRMNRTARALGMTRSTFRNAHGLTEEGHLSTARDMTILGRHLFYDYPDYYNLFSRRSTDAGVREVSNTNRRLLSAYRGADGIKTGYTRAAGFNLVASAERGSERIIATVFGGRSSATRNARVAELLDMGFQRAPSRVAVNRPALPVYDDNTTAVASGTSAGTAAGRTIRLVTAVNTSLRPTPRPTQAPTADILIAMQSEIENAIQEVQQSSGTTPAATAETTTTPAPRPSEAETEAIAIAAATQAAEEVGEIVLAAAEPAKIITPEPKPEAQDPVIVMRVSTSGGEHWGVNVGRYGSRYQAERVLLRTALNEMTTLDGALRRVVQRGGGFEANFMGMTEEAAELACRRLQARAIECTPFGPSS
jgi:D-alanyl-D-alanine carboxypeptidase